MLFGYIYTDEKVDMYLKKYLYLKEIFTFSLIGYKDHLRKKWKE